jgi:hypothetical protein
MEDVRKATHTPKRDFQHSVIDNRGECVDCERGVSITRQTLTFQIGGCESIVVVPVAYIRKQQTMPLDRRSDKGLPTNLNSVIPVPLSRKPSGFLFPL